MQAAATMNSMSFADFLVFVREADVKHEYENGRVYAMAGASLDHCSVVSNLIVELGSSLRNTACRALASDALVRIQTATDDIGYYPDVVVVCSSSNQQYITEPKLIVEVLSRSTRHKDLTVKMENYRLLASLQEYVLVDIDRRTVVVHKRLSANQWLTTIYGAGTVTFDSLAISIPIESIFLNVGT